MTLGPGLARTLLPKGFLAAGINCGVRKYRPDLGGLFSQKDAVTVGVFTKNECKAAPVKYCQHLLPAQNIRAIVTNSGQANAATGEEGAAANLSVVEATAAALACKPEQVLIASTGVIGVLLDTAKINPAIPELVERAGDTAESFALAILTTDLIPKSVSTTVKLSNGVVRITGICKGSGMIHPNMATMLGYLLTDAVLPVEKAQALLREVNDVSFNMISVDGDTSTNDCVFLMANGATGVGPETAEDEQKFSKAMTEVAQSLAQSIARDGEGATKLIEVEIENAPEVTMARRAARGLTVSPLLKAAIHGEDPNWGRVLARLGAEQVPAHCLDRMTLRMQGTKIFENGRPLPFDREAVKQKLKKDTVKIQVDLCSGSASAKAWGCDLSKKYVDINAEYT